MERKCLCCFEILPLNRLSEYRRIMTGEKHDMDGDNYNTKKEHEKTILFVARIYDWVMTVLECIGTHEKHGGTGKKIFGERSSALLE